MWHTPCSILCSRFYIRNNPHPIFFVCLLFIFKEVPTIEVFLFFGVFFYMLGKWCSLYICMCANLNSWLEGKLEFSYTHLRSCTGNEYTSVGQLPKMETDNWQFSKTHNRRLFSWVLSTLQTHRIINLFNSHNLMTLEKGYMEVVMLHFKVNLKFDYHNWIYMWITWADQWTYLLGFNFNPMDLAHCSKEPLTEDKRQNANKRKIIVILYQGQNAFKIRLANIIKLEKFRTQYKKLTSLY